MFNASKIINIFIISLIFITIPGCDDNDDWIPNVRVNLNLHLYTDLSTLGIMQAGTWPGGVNGIIVFRLADREFNAFDRTCPYHPLEDCPVFFNEDVLLAECRCCESLFELFQSGAVEKGPARRPLKQYRTAIVGNYLQISN